MFDKTTFKITCKINKFENGNCKKILNKFICINKNLTNLFHMEIKTVEPRIFRIPDKDLRYISLYFRVLYNFMTTKTFHDFTGHPDFQLFRKLTKIRLKYGFMETTYDVEIRNILQRIILTVFLELFLVLKST